jgi:hypothetical protein
MIGHDLGLEADRVVIAFDIVAQLLGGALGVEELRIGFDGLDQPVVAVDRL